LDKSTPDIESAATLITPPGDGHKQKKKRKKKYHIFTEEEEIFIVKNYGKKTEAEIAKELGLTRKQIEQKIYWMRRTGKWDKIQSAIKTKPSTRGEKRPKYLSAVVCDERNCQDCEYGIKEEIGDAYWCEKLKKRVFPQEAMP
jgi:hypothetical protein